MAFFDSLLGAGVSALGGLLGSQQTQQGQTQTSNQQQAQRESLTNQFQAFPGAGPGLSIFGPGGSSQFGENGVNQTLSPGFAQQLGLFSGLAGGQGGGDFGGQSGIVGMLSRLLLDQRQGSRKGLESRRLNDLRTRARPFEDELREQTRSQVFNQGRLGFGRRGTLTGLNANPELAALEEGLARADLARQESATQFSERRRQQNFDEVAGLLSTFAGLGTQGLQNQTQGLQNQIGASNQSLALLQPQMAATQLGIQGRTPLQNLASGRQIDRDFSTAGQFTNPAVAAQQRARGIEGFFAGLGGGVADAGLFGGDRGGGVFSSNAGLARFDPVTGDPIN